MDVLKKSLLVPTSSSKKPIDPIPTVVPTIPLYHDVGDTGKRTLWVVFVIMLLSTIAFSVLAYRVPVQKRLFHILTAFITTFATISYFAMASGDGNDYSFIKTVDNYDVYRQIFYARYIDWSLTTPLLLLDLAFLAGLNGANIIVAIVADVIMILTGLFAAFGSTSSQKWGYYAIACIAFLVVIFVLAVTGRRTVAARDSKVSTFFASISLFTLVIWTIYPIVWGLGEGAQVIGVDAEIVAYAILDILAKPVFGFWLLLTHDRVASTNVHLEGAWSNGFGKHEGALRVGDDDEGA
ncbi:MAG: hypothetical protein M1833_003816 [Piccolia ochrophora]|nr:MAG: hypothetical protein M1833_003816 [Piccolia ochrophora]